MTNPKDPTAPTAVTPSPTDTSTRPQSPTPTLDSFDAPLRHVVSVLLGAQEGDILVDALHHAQV